MSALFLFIGFVAVGTVILLLAIRKSPMGFEDETGFHFDSFNEDALRYLQTAKWEERFLRGYNSRMFSLRMVGMTKSIAVFLLVAVLVILPKPSTQVERVSWPESLGAKVNGSKESGAATALDSKFSQKLCSRFNQIE